MQKNSILSRTIYLSTIIILCLFLGMYGVFSAYKNIRRIAFGEYREAIEKNEEEIKIFDYIIK